MPCLGKTTSESVLIISCLVNTIESPMSVFPKQKLGWWGFILGYQETPIFIHVLLFRPSILRAVYNILKLGSPESVHTNFWGLWKIFNYVSKLSCQIYFRGTPRLWSFCRVFFYDKLAINQDGDISDTVRRSNIHITGIWEQKERMNRAEKKSEEIMSDYFP